MTFAEAVRLALAFVVGPWIALQVAARCALRGPERRRSDKGWTATSIMVIGSMSLELIFGSGSLVARAGIVLVIVAAAIADALLIALFVEHGRRHSEA